MRCSVASQLQRLSRQSFAELCSLPRCRPAPPLQHCTGRRMLQRHHSVVADSGRQEDANRAHKQTLSALSKARLSTAATHPAADSYETVIGLEVHCQLITATKLFSPSSSAFGSAPNSQTSAIDAALPGSLPHTINRECVLQCIRTALCLDTQPQPVSRFDRKHYFYADMPQGYQITQQHHPVIRGGRVGPIRVDRVQLEQDSGKCLHDLSAHYTHVDLNRAGMPLIEVVTQPDMRSGEEAVAFVRKLSELLRHAGICRAQMEDGSMRCDVNVSVRRRGQTVNGERVEIKNLNSLRSLHRAIQYETDRQITAYESGLSVQRETRTFDSKRGVSILLRSKEQMLDYRFMAEPDVPWLHIPHSMVAAVGRTMGETHDQQRERLVSQYGLSEYDAQVIVSEQGATAYFERLVHGEETAGKSEQQSSSVSASTSARKQLRSPKLAVSWLTSELFGRIRRRQVEQQQQTHWMDGDGEEEDDTSELRDDGDGGDGGSESVSAAEERRIRGGGRREQLLSSCPVSSAQLASVIDLVQAGRISGKTAKQIVDEMFDDGSARPQGESAADVIARLGLSTVERDAGQLDEWVSAALTREAEGVERFVQKANGRFIGFLVGEVLKAAGGKADPKEVATRVQTALQQRVDASRGQT